MPNGFLKSTFETVWKNEYELLDEVSQHKFRNNKLDVNQWLMRDWQLASGNFALRSVYCGKYYEINDCNFDCKEINCTRAKMVCLNDVFIGNEDEFQAVKKILLLNLKRSSQKNVLLNCKDALE